MTTGTCVKTAFVYAYRTKDAERWGIDPNRVDLAYQIDQPLFPHQCDFGRELTAQMLREFRRQGGRVRVVNTSEELIMPLNETKVPVPVPQRLLREWGLQNIIENI